MADEQQWQDAERLRALEILRGRVERGSLALPVVWRIRKLLFWVIERSQLSDQVKREAELLRGTSELLTILTSSTPCVRTSGSTTRWSSTPFPSDAIRRKQRAVEFLKAHGSVGEQIARIERLSKDSLDAGIKPEGIDPLLTRLTRCSKHNIRQSSQCLLRRPILLTK